MDSNSPHTIVVRRGAVADAGAACDVVRRSIEELCFPDHRNDAATLKEWLSNKTPDWFERLLTSPARSCVVATRAEGVCGFGHLNHAGQIGLLYVAPETRLLGAGSLLLAWLEEEALRVGLETIRLNSTGTARSFYMARGFIEAGDPSPGFGITTQFPLLKNLLKHPPENNRGSRNS